MLNKTIKRILRNKRGMAPAGGGGDAESINRRIQALQNNITATRKDLNSEKLELTNLDDYQQNLQAKLANQQAKNDPGAIATEVAIQKFNAERGRIQDKIIAFEKQIADDTELLQQLGGEMPTEPTVQPAAAPTTPQAPQQPQQPQQPPPQKSQPTARAPTQRPTPQGMTNIAANQVGGGGSGRQGGGGGEGPPLFSVFISLLLALLAFFVYKAGGSAAWKAMLPFALIIAAIWIGKAAANNQGTWTEVILVTLLILCLLAATYFFVTNTSAYAMQAYQGYVSGEGGGLNQTVGKGKEGISTVISKAYADFLKQKQIATGERVEGETDKTVKEPIGLSILPPYLPNPKTVRENDIQKVEIGARIKGFTPKNPVNVYVYCGMQSVASQKNITMQPGFVDDYGERQTVDPANGFVGDLSFEQEATCYPVLPGCGQYYVILRAEAQNLRTDAQMQNYVIDKTVYRTKLTNYAKEKGIVLESESQISSAIQNEIFKGQLTGYKSLSDNGAIKVIMETAKIPLIPVDSTTDFTFKIGIENTMNGWITKVNRLEVTLPDLFDIKSGGCDAWTQEGKTIKLSTDYLDKLNFKGLPKGQQWVSPSCKLTPSYGYDITEPTQATYLALVDYNYVVQEKYQIAVKNATGGDCQKTTAPTGTSSTGAQTGVTDQQAKQIQTAIDACNGKSSGDKCGSGNEYCTTRDGKFMCSAACEYNAANSLNGLTPDYGCYSAISYCREGTTKDISCASSYIPGYPFCCIQK